jgi:hypothetical protein
VEETSEVYSINETEPEPLPFILTIGTEHTFKCKQNWSNFAGETVRIEPVAANASTKSYSYITPRVKLNVVPDFNVTKSVDYFYLSVENAESVANLTISDIMLFGASIKANVTPTLPYVLIPNATTVFRCDYDWQSLRGQNVTITVMSSEGYEKAYTTNKLLGAILDIKEVKFDYSDVTYFNLTISNSEDSTTYATIKSINVTLHDGTRVLINQTVPPITTQSIFSMIPENESRTFKCFWNWNQHRNETITVDAYTLEGFTVYNLTIKTPLSVVWNMTDVKFDFDDVQHFLVNVTNTACSLQEINITKILLNSNQTTIGLPIIIQPNQTRTINCTFAWKNSINKTVTVNVFTKSNSNISRTIEIPAAELKLLGNNFVFGELHDQPSNTTTPYVNVTISNSVNSIKNVNITKIILSTHNKTYEIDGTLTYPQLTPNGTVLRIGETITMTCPWNWVLYLGPYPITVTVYTAEGFQVSRTWYP